MSTTPTPWLIEQAYLKASNPATGDQFSVVAISADGNTVAIGAPREASAATGIDGDATNDAAPRSGAVYVYSRTGMTWSFQAYVKASNTDTEDGFGRAVALSADGNVLAVGAPFESSAATGIGGNQQDDSALYSGAVYTFSRAAAVWSQTAYVKASNTGSEDRFGHAVALSADGATLAVGARDEASAASGVDGNQADNTKPRAGAAYLFTRSGASWRQDAYIKASNPDPNDEFGWAIALASDGATLAVSSTCESSAASDFGGLETDNSAQCAGAVYVFRRSGGWSQQAYLKGSGVAGFLFGWSVALSGEGNTLAVGTPLERSSATGIDGNSADRSAFRAGAVFVYAADGATWKRQAYVKASNTRSDPNNPYASWGEFGDCVALSSDGTKLLVGAPLEPSSARGIDGDQQDRSSPQSGAVYVFERATEWAQRGYVKTSNADAYDMIGVQIAISGDGQTFAVSALGEASAAQGVDGNSADNTLRDASAVYVFEAQ